MKNYDDYKSCLVKLSLIEINSSLMEQNDQDSIKQCTGREKQSKRDELWGELKRFSTYIASSQLFR